MKYLITGGTGFVGSALAREIRSLGHEIILATRGRRLAADVNNWVEYDLTEAATIANIIEAKPDGIFHLAWTTTPGSAQNDPAGDAMSNLVGLLSLFQKLSGTLSVPLVFASSGGTVYGKAKVLPISESHPLEPVSIYGITKVAAENYATNFRRLKKLDIRIARLSNPFGASQSPAKLQGAASIFARQVALGEKVTVWGDGSVVRDYIDVSDAARALVAIMTAERADWTNVPVFNVGGGGGLSLNELLDIIADAAACTPDVSYIEGRSFDIPANVLDISLIERQTGWSPRQTVQASIRDMVRSLRQLSD